MELIIISESKFKIMLSEPDMKHYELNPDEMLDTDQHTRLAFRHLLDDCGPIGQETRGERLFVQVYTSKGGGCEIFVTKMGDTCEHDGVHAPLRLTKGEQALKDKIMNADRSGCITTLRVDQAPFDTRIYRFLFSNLQDAIAACRRLKGSGCAGSVCYAIHGSDELILELYLSLEEDGNPSARYAFLHDYGKELSADPSLLSLYIGEYTDMLIPANAVELLSGM